ncbi:hypothetical protein T07_8800 [Trichinella nelsoni]|uniref:Uncharacterized protein n=1 Tax=Trichinella nelsoni TaxID=6336 RepID=A0A0V0RDI1_9BILA|nr:hypothetical protein T07_8800 [Trichinella nelsoni]
MRKSKNAAKSNICCSNFIKNRLTEALRKEMESDMQAGRIKRVIVTSSLTWGRNLHLKK